MSLLDVSVEGFTEEDIKKIQKLEKKFDFHSLQIQQTIPFAPFLFAGAVITYFFGNILNLMV